MNPPAIAILGGGVTGLSAAHRLTALGRRVRVFERRGQLGGAIRTEAADGWLVEGGPNSLLESPEAAEIIREVGLESERIEASLSAKKRYLVRGGRLLPVPISPAAFFTSPLLSIGAKFRVLAEMSFRPRTRDRDMSLADFICAHFGREVVDYALQPFVSGIYAGDAARLSTRHAFPQLWERERRQGSLLRGQIAAARSRRAHGGGGGMVSFRRGLQTLPEALAAGLPPGAVTLNAAVERIEALGGQWKITPPGAPSETFAAVISALPAPALACLSIGAPAARPLAPLADVLHSAVASLFLGYRREQVAHPLDGFGVLVPAIERRSLLGVIFNSSLFPGRAPPGHVALTVMIGGLLQPEIASRPVSSLLAAVRGDLRDLLGVEGEPVFVRHTHWPQAIPQYHLGYEKHLAVMADCEKAHPGLFIGGQVRDGISLAASLVAGRTLADRAAQTCG